MKTAQEKAIEIAKLMEDGKGQNVVAIDVSKLNSWTDCFVIVTVSSSTQMEGLSKMIKDYAKENDMEMYKPNKKMPDGNDWKLIDIGNVVVHLMSEDARNFYELEKLWHAGVVLSVNQ